MASISCLQSRAHVAFAMLMGGALSATPAAAAPKVVTQPNSDPQCWTTSG